MNDGQSAEQRAADTLDDPYVKGEAKPNIDRLFVVGDVVFLKSASLGWGDGLIISMTVLRTGTEGVICGWHDQEGHFHEQEFYNRALVLVPDGSKEVQKD